MLALVLVGTALGVKHEWDLGQAARVQVKQVVATSKAQLVAVAKVDQAATAAEPKAQAIVVTRYKTLVQKVPTYVPVSSPCIPWGLVRLHDAAAAGVDPSTLQPPASAADDACSDVAPDAFMATVVANYGLAAQNAEQLNALEADLRARAAAVAPK
jgi:hypothetical protein